MRIPFLLIPFVPALTMRAWSEEHAQGTVELLLTLPLQPVQVVTGKYSAALLYYGLILAGSLPIVAMLLWLVMWLVAVFQGDSLLLRSAGARQIQKNHHGLC